MLEELKQRGWKTDMFFSHTLFNSKKSLEELKERIKDVEIIGLSFPLYVDGIPGPMVEVLSALCKGKEFVRCKRDQKIFCNGELWFS